MSSSLQPEPTRTPVAQRFLVLFGHEPGPEELERWRRSRQALALGVPARVRRGAARLVTRL